MTPSILIPLFLNVVLIRYRIYSKQQAASWVETVRIYHIIYWILMAIRAQVLTLLFRYLCICQSVQ
jgi:hypothetical protein